MNSKTIFLKFAAGDVELEMVMSADGTLHLEAGRWTSGAYDGNELDKHELTSIQRYQSKLAQKFFEE